MTNMRFADGIVALAEKRLDQETLVESLDKTCAKNKMEIIAEKTKFMTQIGNGIQKGVNVKGSQLNTITSFKYLEANVSDKGFKSLGLPEV